MDHSLWNAQAISIAIATRATVIAFLQARVSGSNWDRGGTASCGGSTDNESGRNCGVGELHFGIKQVKNVASEGRY